MQYKVIHTDNGSVVVGKEFKKGETNIYMDKFVGLLTNEIDGSHLYDLFDGDGYHLLYEKDMSKVKLILATLPPYKIEGIPQSRLPEGIKEFQWTDTLVLEFAVVSHLPNREVTIKEFKESKQPTIVAVEVEMEWINPCNQNTGCKENKLLGEETDICRDGCVQSKPIPKLVPSLTLPGEYDMIVTKVIYN